jgi:argininosuccinate lyase
MSDQNAKSSSRLWDKGDELNQQVHRFTVGNDPVLDLVLLRWDVLGSAAHARMLGKIGILSSEEVASLLKGLREIYDLSLEGEFEIPDELEDCHTAIESYLVETVGQAGERIHTGRSRNDQVLLATRLYLRDAILAVCEGALGYAAVLEARWQQDGKVQMPGYTHMQAAMPSSVGMWLHAYYEWALEFVNDGLSLLHSIDVNPLGSASGFGVPLELDRDYTAELLGFRAVQRNPIAVQNSRGRYELKVLNWLTEGAALIEKFAADMLLYSMHAFGFFSLPVELTTGSSIMPQKRNPDVLELLRAKASQVRGSAIELMMVIGKLPSHYHRDFQLTKEPILRGVNCVFEAFEVAEVVADSFSINPESIEAAMTDDLFATYDTYKQVREGVPFREAYRNTAKRAKEGAIDVAALKGDFALIEQTNEKEMAQAGSEFHAVEERLQKYREKIDRALALVLESE